jgi:putative ABC transport system substrate-binding protein
MTVAAHKTVMAAFALTAAAFAIWAKPAPTASAFAPATRPDFITLLASAVAWPLPAHAQEPAMPVIGFLFAGDPEPSARLVAAFRQGLSETGYVEGRNVMIEYRWAGDDGDRLPELVADLVGRVTVLAAPGSMAAALAAKAATTTIPIVFSTGGDPVESGLVASYNRPGGNVTGVSSMNLQLGAKRIGLLHELVPGAARFAALVGPDNPTADSLIADVRAGAAAIGRQIEVLTARTNRDIDMGFASLVPKGVDALVLIPGQLFSNHPGQLATLAARYAVPAIYPSREMTEAGGLMSYGPSLSEEFQQAGIYTGRVLRGEKPADLPILQPTKFELAINLKTAKALGLDVPRSLLVGADEVIE